MFHDRPWTWHHDSCADLGGLWNLPVVKGKTRLNVLVMLTPLYHGRGPHHFSRQYLWPYRGLIVSTDPVAADSTGAFNWAPSRESIKSRHMTTSL